MGRSSSRVRYVHKKRTKRSARHAKERRAAAARIAIHAAEIYAARGLRGLADAASEAMDGLLGEDEWTVDLGGDAGVVSPSDPRVRERLRRKAG